MEGVFCGGPWVAGAFVLVWGGLVELCGAHVAIYYVV